MPSYLTTYDLSGNSRPIGWIKAARKTFGAFPDAMRSRPNAALTIAAEGGEADIARPLKGLGSGVFQIAVRRRTGAWRAAHVAERAGRPWIVHAFRKKSKLGIGTPKPDVDPIANRLGRLKRGSRPVHPGPADEDVRLARRRPQDHGSCRSWAGRQGGDGDMTGNQARDGGVGGGSRAFGASR